MRRQANPLSSDPVSATKPVAWRPTLAKQKGETKHSALTERIIADIDAGVLKPMDRMPTHRDLARELGLSVQTVSLSYKEAERLGYLSGEIGRGTFVKTRVTDRAGRMMLDHSPTEVLDLSIIRGVYLDDHENASRAILRELADGDNSGFMRPCRPVAGLDSHRETARIWLGMMGVTAGAERILVTNGAAHGIFLALSCIIRSNDVVLCENLTDHGIIGLSNILGFSLKGLPTDEEGILPDALEAACAAGGVRAVVLIPTLNNPTGHVSGAARRRAIAAIAERYGVFVIEDEVYRPIIEDDLPSITEMLPDLGFFVTSFTKTVLTGLRVGYLVVPPSYSIRAASILRVSSWSGTYLTAEIATRWVENGTARRLLDVQRAEVRARQRIATDILGDHIASSHPLSFCAWLKVPPRWTEDGLVRALTNQNVAVTPSEPFIAGPGHGGGIRICLGGRLNHSSLVKALTTVRQTFEQLPPVYDIGSIG
ncbi:PLP-dependent aminotransferase family protein [Agrobacterium tumefaciens]|uniref:MocR-like ectoine utilization transcription factor EhuR n=1 Tax=Agrobacterium tumefaciens TaxID=358 RepID=UPI00157496DE|nr:PLP-dependent aminotransferase family protein [Agrobacterium tumefaciens]NTB99765.1 PLP-dependent aminotransferase family protein [Agrobacterium tumefaciens]NTB99782.1 PLP-dependent aminotransferase family protein [Agrobacterium tumefaciens]NTC47542.1 PLP-dependent aminotransferase family protein [Agrobacterium tumefaciens]NTC47559.1 PLP-dependent aminotransferase family protein [Agrobacterium tumefaciens]